MCWGLLWGCVGVGWGCGVQLAVQDLEKLLYVGYLELLEILKFLDAKHKLRQANPEPTSNSKPYKIQMHKFGSFGKNRILIFVFANLDDLHSWKQIFQLISTACFITIMKPCCKINVKVFFTTNELFIKF